MTDLLDKLPGMKTPFETEQGVVKSIKSKVIWGSGHIHVSY